MELNFGIMGTAPVERKIAAVAPFRLAILGDFAAAANKGRLETGNALARRKPLRVDVDNIDQVIERLAITLSLPMAEGAVEVPITAMDDFHPDQLYENVELFTAMADLRRRLTSKSGFPAAAKELAAWRDEPEPDRPAAVLPRPRGAMVPRGGKRSDFARLIGQPTAAPSAAELAVADLLKSIVRPYIVKGKDPQHTAALAALDRALAATMRKLLRHPDFQILESLWRSVDLLTRRIETSTQLQIVLYDVSAEEFAADLSLTESLEEAGLYKLLVEQPGLDANQGALSAMIGAYVFDQTPPQAELLGRMAKLAARAQAPFIASIIPDFLDTKPEDVHPLIREAWRSLRKIPEACYLALVTPRYLLRQPYGERTDPIGAFDGFEEFTPQTGLKGMLWGNPAFVAGLMLAQSFAEQGPKMTLGSIMSAGDMPYYFYVDEDGDQTALPCTERLMSERTAARTSAEHFIALLSVKGRPEIRLSDFTSLAGTPLAGRWAPVPAEPAPGTTATPARKPGETAIAVAAPADAASGGDESAPEAATERASTEGDDSELDSLLAALKTDEDNAPPESTESSEAKMDPELAALLKGM